MPVDAIACKICGGPSRFLCETRNEFGPVRSIRHFRCSSCGIVFVGNRLTNDEIGAAYSAFDMSTYFDEIREENRKKFVRAASDLESLPGGKNQYVVDIGGGNGEFARMLLERGFDRVAIHEIPGADLSAVAAMGVTIYRDFDFASLPSATFDAVTLLDVAEHVPDPWRLLRACSRVLRKGGTIYIHTPVVTWLDRLMHQTLRLPPTRSIGRTWQVGRTTIFHLQNYTAPALRLLLEHSGFRDIRIDLRNELSWPLDRYVKVYLCDKVGIPAGFAPVIAPVFRPLLATNFFNANKAIVFATACGNGDAPAVSLSTREQCEYRQQNSE